MTTKTALTADAVRRIQDSITTDWARPDPATVSYATIREVVDEAWRGGRDEAGRELADVLGGLIEAGRLPFPDAVLAALGPLIPEPDPASHGPRLAEATGLDWYFSRYASSAMPSERISALPPPDPETAAGASGKACPDYAAWAERRNPGEPGLPLSDEGAAAEAQADAAERLAGLGWTEISTTPPERRQCPDSGTCHHHCTTGCWRVRNASPLSIAGWGDQWPDDIRRAHERSDGVL